MTDHNHVPVRARHPERSPLSLSKGAQSKDAPLSDRFDLIVWGVVGLLSLALVGVLVVGDRLGARVVGTTPESNGLVSARGRLGIEFAQPMNTASVESGFAVEPPIKGRFIWQDKTMWFVPGEPFERGVTYTARLAAGVSSASGQQVKNDVTWTFAVRDPAILYIAPASETRELWSVAVSGSEPKALTGTGGRLYDFAPAPDGELIAYTVANDQNGIDLWLMSRDGSAQRLGVECGADRCTTPDWSPDGNRLVFSRENAGIAPGAPHGPPRAWVLDLASGQTSPVYQDSQLLGYGPSWSPDGRRIAAWDGVVGGIRVLDLQTGDTMMLQSQMGAVGTWSPDGQLMLYNDLSVTGEQPYVRMFVADFQTKQVTPALENAQALQQVDFSTPAWSPDGEWVAAGLRMPTSGMGGELWIMHPDGSGAQAVASDPQYTYGAYRWDPWSEALIFQRFELGLPFAKPQILLWSPGQSVRVIAEDASLPAWLP